MTKLSAFFIATVALLAGVQAANCPPNTRLCGGEITGTYGCMTPADIIFITPHDNKPEDCNFRTDGQGAPQALGANCCAEGRCFNAGPNGVPPARCG